MLEVSQSLNTKVGSPLTSLSQNCPSHINNALIFGIINQIRIASTKHHSIYYIKCYYQ